jgi:hypothetical protein
MDKITIANLALSQIGEQTIQSFQQENNKNAEIIRLIFNPILEQVLRNHNWSCATYRRQLARTTKNPPFGFAYSYQLPADPKCLKVLYLDDVHAQFKVEGKEILTDRESSGIVYIGQVDDMNQLDTLFVRVFYLSLATEMSYRQMGTGNLVQQTLVLLQSAWEDARFADASENSPMYIDESDLIKSRYVGHRFLEDQTTMR